MGKFDKEKFKSLITRTSDWKEKAKQRISKSKMTHYYLLNGNIMKSKTDMPLHAYSDHPNWQNSKMYLNSMDYNNWINSLIPCSITEGHLENIEIWLSENSYDGDWKQPIDVTEIIYAIYDRKNDIDIIEFKDSLISINEIESQENLYKEFAHMIMCGGLNLCKKHFTLIRKNNNGN